MSIVTVYDLPCRTAAEYATICRECGTDPMSEESAILSVGAEFLPPCARAVLSGGEPTADYWEWMGEQTRTAQREHDAEVAR